MVRGKAPAMGVTIQWNTSCLWKGAFLELLLLLSHQHPAGQSHHAQTQIHHDTGVTGSGLGGCHRLHGAT